MPIGLYSVRCVGHDGAGWRCAALGPAADTVAEAQLDASNAGFELRGDGRWLCPACARRDVVAARADDGVAGGARGT